MKALALSALIVLGLLSACGEKAPADEAPATAVDRALVARLGDAARFEVTAARPYAALGCLNGPVDGLDVLVCVYPDDAAAEAALTPLKQFVAGAVTGVARRQGVHAVAIADRGTVDPKGERIAKLLQQFSATP